MKKNVFLFAIILTFIFSGCSSLQSSLSNKIKAGSGIFEDEDYLNYLDAVEKGIITADGKYIDTSETEEDGIKSGTIHVTFSKNSNLKVSYFVDEKKTKQIDTDNCYLNPGDVIYAEVGVNKNVFSSMYEFSNFEILNYETGEKPYSVKDDFAVEGNIIKIPANFSGTELQVIPLGRYQDRVLRFSDYYVNEEGNKVELSGTWMVDDKEYDDLTATINAIDSYIVSYSYDSDMYFYVTSSPASYYTSNSEGVVIFKQREASEVTNGEYSVELSKYFTVKFTTDKERQISINDPEGEMTKYKYGTEIKLGEEFHIQYGTIITLTTNKPWNQDDLEKTSKLIQIGVSEKNGRYTYELKYPDRTGGFLFNPKDYEYDNGTITFKVNGEVVTGPVTLMPGQRLAYEECPDDGYMLSNGNGEITIETPDEAKKLLLELHFIERPIVTVNLNRPKEGTGGTVRYYFDNKEITGDTIQILSGQKITVVFEPWYGWKLKANIKSPSEYTANTENGQMVQVIGYDPGNVFVEDDSHKVKITVATDKSIAALKDWEIAVKIGDYSEKVVYSKDSKTLDCNLGSNQAIEIIPDNHSEIKGKALKIKVEFYKGSDENPDKAATKILYETDFSKKFDPIYIYEGGNDVQKRHYSKVKITVSLVDITVYRAPTPGPNTDIEIKVNSNSIAEGDLIEPSAKISIWIKPHPGYYISGKGSDDQGYYDTMTYEEYCKQNVINDHPAKEYLKITLDKSDSFATYKYTIDGKEVSGTVEAKEGQTLTLKYTINSDSDQKLKYPSGNFFNKNYKSKTVTLKITAAHDGKTITRKDFDKMELKGE